MIKTKKWIISQDFDKNDALDIQKRTGLSALTSSVLCARGVKTDEEIKAFLDTSAQKLCDPMRMKNMGKAVEIIINTLKENKKIAVYGDYDVDGITSVCVITKYLRSVGADCIYYIPDRLSEGYGLNREAIDRLKDQGVELIVTVDTGVTAIEEAEYCKSIGVKLVITDHHECKDVLPDADAVVNPKQPGCEYDFKELAGVGVAWSLVRALDIVLKKNKTEQDTEYITFVAIGTIADVMPLVGENRYITDIGIRKLAMTRNVGLRALMRHCAQDGREKKRVSATTVSFTLAPRINAAGRLGKAELAAELFLTGDANSADMLASKLCEMNRERQAMENKIFEEATEQLGNTFDRKKDKAIVLWHENWHHGVIGIVASKLADKYFCPSILISVDEGEGKGSGRSIKGFNLFEALSKCSHLLSKYGGHELAAGLTIGEDNLQQFRKELYEYASDCLTEECIPTVEIDCEIDASMLTLDAVDELAKLEPYGMGNPQPKFCIKNMKMLSMIPIGNDKHARFTLESNGRTYDAVMFGASPDELPLADGDEVDIAFTADINSFRGREVQLILKDIRRCEGEMAVDEADLVLYKKFKSTGKVTPAETLRLKPDREELVAIWRGVNRYAGAGKNEDNRLTIDASKFYRKLRFESKTDINLGKLLVALDIFTELELFDHSFDDDDCVLNIKTRIVRQKMDLNSSNILRELKACESN